MAERIKDRVTGWLITALFTLLGFIATGIGYLIMQSNERMDYIEERQIIDESSIRNIANVLDNDPDTSPENKKELRKIYFNTRAQ